MGTQYNLLVGIHYDLLIATEQYSPRPKAVKLFFMAD
jgi:hypothetical protein